MDSTRPVGAMLHRILLALAGSLLIWLLLVGNLDPQELLAGAVISALVVAISLPRLGLLDGLILRPQLPWHMLRYLAVFLRALVESNLDMARRVVSPQLPIRPGIVRVQTSLESPLGRLLLANSITLTPGTLTVDLDEATGELAVHWIDTTPGADLQHATQAIAERFERELREVVR